VHPDPTRRAVPSPATTRPSGAGQPGSAGPAGGDGNAAALGLPDRGRGGTAGTLTHPASGMEGHEQGGTRIAVTLSADARFCFVLCRLRLSRTRDPRATLPSGRGGRRSPRGGKLPGRGSPHVLRGGAARRGRVQGRGLDETPPPGDALRAWYRGAASSRTKSKPTVLQVEKPVAAPRTSTTQSRWEQCVLLVTLR
jgi:hypothetical protein